MIVKIIYSKSAAKKGSFSAVVYNTGKVDRNKGELMKEANFNSLGAFSKRRPQDYINYLKSLAAGNFHVKDAQLHAVISGKGQAYDKHALTRIADNWLKEMGYGTQPYLLIYHKDTANNHLHIVSSRVDRNGKKISSAFEKRRAVSALNKVLGYDFGFSYRFSTRAQFLTLLENQGFLGVDPEEKKISQRIRAYATDKERAAELRAILKSMRQETEFIWRLKTQYNIDLAFHGAEGKQPYGYTIIDHDEKTVFKGSEVLALKELMGNNFYIPASKAEIQAEHSSGIYLVTVQPISIADDVDDQQIHGMRRKRQKKARTNTR